MASDPCTDCDRQCCCCPPCEHDWREVTRAEEEDKADKEYKEKFEDYYYRGSVERGADYTRCDGYSQYSERGRLITYPWSTKKECREMARSRGKTAVFFDKDEKPC